RADGRGRVMVMEILFPNAAIRNLIREDKIHQIYSAMQTGTGQTGMQTFNQALANTYFQKLITLETALSRTSIVDELQDMINRGVASAPAGAIAPARRERRSFGPQNQSRYRETRHASEHLGRLERIGAKGTMPVYTYRGTNRSGVRVSGEQVAASKAELAALLRRQQINVSKMSEKGKEFSLPFFQR